MKTKVKRIVKIALPKPDAMLEYAVARDGEEFAVRSNGGDWLIAWLRRLVPATELLARQWLEDGFEPIYHRALVEAGLV